MSKRSNTQETLIIAIELLRRIPRNRRISSEELHQQLKEAGHERNIRTIQRQLEVLCEQFDIERDDRIRPYGYRWKERANGLSLPMLTEQESLLLTLAEQYLHNLLPANLMKSMEGFFAQAKYKLGSVNSKKNEREWLSKVRIVSTSQPLLPAKIRDGVFDEVSNALYGNRWLHIEYENASSQRGEYEVMPLGLAQQGPRLYLVCRYKGYDNERSLALHRIIRARASAFTFDRPKEFNLEQYDNDGRFGFGEGQRIKLSFRITKEAGFHLLETPLSKDQTVNEYDNEYEITATVVDTEQLKWWLRGFGDQVSNIQKHTI